MIDYSLPKTSRTRQRQDKAYKFNEKKKKQKKNAGGSAPADCKKFQSPVIELSDDDSMEDVDSNGDSESVQILEVSMRDGGGDPASDSESDDDVMFYSDDEEIDAGGTDSSDDDEEIVLSESEVAERSGKGKEGESVGISTGKKIKRSLRVDNSLGDGPGSSVSQRTCSPSRIVSEPHYPSGHDEDMDDFYENYCSSQRTRPHETKTRPTKKRSNGNQETCKNGFESGVQKVCKNNEGLRKLTKKKTNMAETDAGDFTNLADAIYEDAKRPQEGLAFRDEEPKIETLLQKFTFGEAPTIVPEKSEGEKEIDRLFNEMNFALKSSETDSTDYNVVKVNDSSPTVNEVTQDTLCSRGEHWLILDEEIGYVCKFCFHVHQEIKYILPDFAPNPYGRSVKRFSEENNHWSIPGELQCHKSGSGSNPHVHAKGTVWDLIPGVQSSMYPHQRDGFEFIWSHVAGGIHLEKLIKKSSDAGGAGCIISHAPGTGKTRLTIVFLQAYMRFNPNCRPLIIAPCSMLLTWEEEFKKWDFDFPFHNLNNRRLSGEENRQAAEILVQNGGQRRVKSVEGCRWLKLSSWTKERSVLGISYKLFEQLSAAHNSEAKETGQAKKMGKVLLDLPGIVVFDEGHTPRNAKSHMWNSSLKIKTKRRIILSGTPFQNSFDELFNTLCLVRPKLIKSTVRRQGRKESVTKEHWRSLHTCLTKISDDNTNQAEEIRATLSNVVHVYRGSILHEKLPGVRNSVVVLQPQEFQEKFLKLLKDQGSFFRYEHYGALISVHPSALLNLKKEDRTIFLNQDIFPANWDKLEELRLNPNAGVKAKFVIELIRLSGAMDEKVLVFSQYINSLTFLRELLKSHFQWTVGEEILYMDGTYDEKQRQSSMKAFNDSSSKAKVLLASTKGCNEGISLVGASRVVLLDVTWNPSVEKQAIGRAYRLGQKKIVHVYHLLLAEIEGEKQARQHKKHLWSELLFSGSVKDGDQKKMRAAASEDIILEAMVERLKHIFQNITFLD